MTLVDCGDEFSDCNHSFFLKRKSDQIELLPVWMKELKAKYGIDIKYVRLGNSGRTEVSRENVPSKTLGSYLNSQHLVHLNRILWLKEKYLP